MDLLNLILLGLAASVYPPLLAGVVLMLGRPRPLPMLVGFLGGGMAISIPFGIAIVVALRASGAFSPDSSANPVADLAIGSLSLLLAWGIGTRRITGDFLNRHRKRHSRPQEHTPSFVQRSLGSGSVVMAVVAGVVLNLPGMWYLAALTGIAQSHSSTATTLLGIVLFNVIMFALVEIPIIGYLTEPQRVTALVTRLQHALRDHSRTIAVLLAAAVGIWLIVKGVAALAG